VVRASCPSSLSVTGNSSFFSISLLVNLFISIDCNVDIIDFWVFSLGPLLSLVRERHCQRLNVQRAMWVLQQILAEIWPQNTVQVLRVCFENMTRRHLDNTPSATPSRNGYTVQRVCNVEHFICLEVGLLGIHTAPQVVQSVGEGHFQGSCMFKLFRRVSHQNMAAEKNREIFRQLFCQFPAVW